MPFLIPLLPAIIGAAGAVTGGVMSLKAGGKQKQAIQSQLDIAKAEEARKQAVYDKLAPFFSEYMKSGSPFLQNIQRAGAEQTAQGANNAAGQIREVTGASGMGYGPSGTTAAALGGLGAETGKTASSNYLTNLLNNEQIKFQAAQGLQAAGQGQQISPQPAQYPIDPTAGAIGSLGTILGGLLKKIPGLSGNTVGTLPTGGYPGGPPSSPPIPTAPATTQGWAMGF